MWRFSEYDRCIGIEINWAGVCYINPFAHGQVKSPCLTSVLKEIPKHEPTHGVFLQTFIPRRGQALRPHLTLRHVSWALRALP